MRVKYITIILLIFTLIPAISNAKLAVHPEKISLDLYGGEHITKYLVVAHTEKVPLAVIVKTKIYPDAEGINVTYSKQNFVLFPNQPEIIQMDIDVANNIKPGEYTIKTQFNASILQRVIENQTIITRTVIENATSIVDQIIEQLENQTINMTYENMAQIIQQLKQLRNQLEELSNTSIKEQDAAIDALLKGLNESQKEVDRLKNTLEIALIATILYTSIITLLALLKIRRPGGGDKE